MLNNPFGACLQMLLRNDITWDLFTEQDKERIFKANINHNSNRDDYANPEKYGLSRNPLGENWDSYKYDSNDQKAVAIMDLLEKYKPKKILEFGPGAGYYSRLICEYNTVQQYSCVELAPSFFNYLQPRLEQLTQQKENFSFNLKCGDGTKIQFEEQFDLIILTSTVHHIPNRFDLFSNLNSMLAKNGLIYCIDPSHYILRILQVLKNCYTKGYMNKAYYMNQSNFSTHNMCSYGEYSRVCKKIPSLSLHTVQYELPGKVRKIANLTGFSMSWLSTGIEVLFRKS
ncbi:class I SAM-dependent methyltransferase [bacterium]|nr:class I SAM-dependent methyltransferase [bacterium]